jgi:hypothetical protein
MKTLGKLWENFGEALGVGSLARISLAKSAFDAADAAWGVIWQSVYKRGAMAQAGSGESDALSAPTAGYPDCQHACQKLTRRSEGGGGEARLLKSTP